MYGRATNLAKKAVTEMDKQKLKELVRKSLMNEADIEVGADKYMGEKDLAQASMMLDDFESKLKSHDWYHMMSDDNRAYTKGSAESSELKKLAKQLASMGYGKDAAELYNKYNVFKSFSFEDYIAPPQPFIPGYKRKEMGLDETEFSKEFDNDPALKGGQKKLPDALQKAIVKKEKGVKEGYYGTTNVESYIDALGYESFEDFFGDNPGAETALMNWIESISEFRNKLMDSGMLEEDIDLGHVDNEPHMIKSELYRIGKYSMELYQMMDSVEGMGEVDLPAWWQSKITTAKNMISGAKHYLEFELKEPAIDAIVGVAADEDILDENIGKDEMLAARLYKIKNFVQPAFYQKVRSLINSGDLETAELFISRMEPAAAKNDMEMAKMKGDLEDMDRVAVQRQREKQMANIFVREGKKLTKDELKEIIKNSVNEGDIDEGFLDRVKANISGAGSFVGTGLKNLGRSFMGKELKDPKLEAGMAKLGQKAKTLEKELNDAVNDINKLFPETSLNKAPEELQKTISAYKKLLDQAKTANANIAAGKAVTPPTTSTSTSSPSTTAAPAASTPAQGGGGFNVNPRGQKSAAPATKPAAAPATKSAGKQKMFNYKGKDYPLQTDADGNYIQVGGTKVAVQPKFDPNKGTTTTPTTQTKSPSRDAKGRFTSTKKVAETISQKLKSK